MQQIYPTKHTSRLNRAYDFFLQMYASLKYQLRATEKRLTNPYSSKNQKLDKIALRKILEEFHQKYPLHTIKEALEFAALELDTLADLLEVHFVQDKHEQAQLQLIKLARDLAEQSRRHERLSIHSNVLHTNYEKLYRHLGKLKKLKLITASSRNWADFMRPSARLIAYALHRYSQLSIRHRKEPKQSSPHTKLYTDSMVG